jgi:tetratricopeptide (TPR) repeat protein
MKKWVAAFVLFSAVFWLGGFTSDNPDIHQYQRHPLRNRLKKLLTAGKERYLQRRYEDAMAIFEAMNSLDPNNLDALIWTKKCEQQLFKERNEAIKADIIRKRGSLRGKESGFENWTWGPTVGHFEIRTSKTKPREVPVKKVRPPASEGEISQAKAAAAKGDPNSLFQLALLHNSRLELDEGIKALEEAVEKDNEILSRDDEELTSRILEGFRQALEKGKATTQQRLLAARVAYMQGDWSQAIVQFIKAASKDPNCKPQALAGLKKIIDSGKTGFLQRLPDISLFQQAYAFQEKKDKFYLWVNFAPSSPLYLFPFDLEFEQAAIKKIEVKSPDILFIIPDPFTIDTTRLWVVGKDPDDDSRSLSLKTEITLDETIILELNLSNFLVDANLPGNWSMVFGPDEAFHSGFPIPKSEKTFSGGRLKAYQLSYSSGKGPTLHLPDFRKPLSKKFDVWKEMQEIQEKEGYLF